MIKKADPSEAAAEVKAAIQETLPTAGMQIRTEGSAEQRSLAGAIGNELAGLFRTREPMIFAVTADCNAPRPLRIRCHYIAVGRGAGPTSILYLTRLRHVVPSRLEFKRGAFRSGSFEGDPALAGPLNGVKDLSSGVWKLLQPIAMYGTTVFTIEAAAAVLPPTPMAPSSRSSQRPLGRRSGWAATDSTSNPSSTSRTASRVAWRTRRACRRHAS